MKASDREFYRNIGISELLFEERIKGSPYLRAEDFLVQEVQSNGALCSVEKNAVVPKRNAGKKYLHATLVKKNISTFEACLAIAEENNLDYSGDLSFCGLKDTAGLTAQRICIRARKPLRLKNFKHFFLKDFSFSNKKLFVGAHSGNRFTVRVRNVKTPEKAAVNILERFKERAKLGLPNFYGPQRFGIRQNNPLLGKLLLQGRYSAFVLGFLTYSANEEKETKKIRRALRKNFGDWEKCLDYVDGKAGFCAEKAIILNLASHSNELDAIRSMWLSNFFVHCYSSYLFNLALSSFLSGCHKNAWLEKIGKNSKLNRLNKKLFNPIFKKEGLSQKAFKQADRAFQIRGHRRHSLCYPSQFEYAMHGKNLTLKFGLGKGEYASTVLELLIDSDLKKLN